MNFQEYFDKVCEACIVNVGETWSSYLEPTWKIILKKLELMPEIVEDEEITLNDLSQMLKLEVERRHIVTGKGRALANWVYEIIDGTIEPTLETGENELFEKILELLQKDKKSKEATKSEQKLPEGINFSKRDVQKN